MLSVIYNKIKNLDESLIKDDEHSEDDGDFNMDEDDSASGEEMSEKNKKDKNKKHRKK